MLVLLLNLRPTQAEVFTTNHKNYAIIYSMKVLIHKLSNPYYYLCTIIGITIISGAILSSTSTYSESANATVTVGSACTLTATVNPAHSAEIPAGSSRTDIGLTTLNTICNDAGGFAIYAVGYSNNEYGNNKMLSGSSYEINTGTDASGANSAWSMKLQQVTTGTYATTIDSGFGSYSNIPSTYTRVAHKDSATDAVGTNPIVGSSISLTYGAYISSTQNAGTYEGKVKFTLVHATANPIQPHDTEAGCIRYYPNGGNVEGTMGCQPISATDTSATLLASNFSREGYGFAGWSTTFDYSDSNGFLGPQESITFDAGTYTGDNPGLSLYAVWVASEGSLQDPVKTAALCDASTGGLVVAPTEGKANLASVTALTDQRDGQVYAIAKLADNNCWMIENFRIEAEDTRGDANRALAQGYGVSSVYGNFIGLADAETNFALGVGSNSIYYYNTQDGTATINIGNSDNSPDSRMPRYDNRNTHDRANNDPASNTLRMYSYGNYYSWAAAIASTIYYQCANVNTSICPTGWRIPYGGPSIGNISGGFYYLYLSIKGDSSMTAQQIQKKMMGFPYNYLYSGYTSIGSNSRGSTGWYSTSTSTRVNNYLTIAGIEFTTTSMDAYDHYPQKYHGLPIRCVRVSP